LRQAGRQLIRRIVHLEKRQGLQQFASAISLCAGATANDPRASLTIPRIAGALHALIMTSLCSKGTTFSSRP